MVVMLFSFFFLLTCCICLCECAKRNFVAFILVAKKQKQIENYIKCGNVFLPPCNDGYI